MNIPSKVGFNLPCGFGEKRLKCNSLQTTDDDGRKVMTLTHVTFVPLWSGELKINNVA
jgi:hypothetical protein